jgi:phosphate transport system protein
MNGNRINPAATLLVAALLLAGPAAARDQIRLVGSSTVFPFATAVAEEFGRTTDFKMPIDPALELLANDSQQLLQRALDSFSSTDAAAARSVLDDDDRIDAEEDAVIVSALRGIPENPDSASETVDVIMIAKNLERVGDHATNIAEDVILISEARNVKHASKLEG